MSSGFSDFGSRQSLPKLLSDSRWDFFEKTSRKHGFLIFLVTISTGPGYWWWIPCARCWVVRSVAFPWTSSQLSDGPESPEVASHRQSQICQKYQENSANLWISIIFFRIHISHHIAYSECFADYWPSVLFAIQCYTTASHWIHNMNRLQPKGCLVRL